MDRRTVTTIAVAATVAVAATALVLTGARTSPARALHEAAPPGPQLLRPDVRSLRAGDLQILSFGARRELRFAAMLADDGPGPLVLEPRAGGTCPPGQRLAVQRVYVDRDGNGRYQRAVDTGSRVRPAGCMLNHPTHNHWHFDAMAAYRLVDVTPKRRVVVQSPKVSFCLRDNRTIPGTTPRQRRAFFGECGRDIVQGISPGWLDLYDAATPGQSLALPPRMPDGVYCLVLRADARDQLVETDETDNAAVRPVRVRGDLVTTPDVPTCRGLLP